MTLNDYLSHHGVKGQQWGIRRGPPYPIDEDNYVTRIRKGTEIRRLSVRDESVATGHAYVTYLKSDTHRSKGFFGANLRRKSHGATVYSIKMSAKEELISPSKKTRVDTFLKLWEDDPVFRKELGAYHKGDWHHFTPLPKAFYEMQYKNLKGDKVMSVGYETLKFAVGGNEYVRNAYFKRLAQQGYSFVMDECDAGRFGKAPSIIFDRQKSVNYEGQTEVSKKEINTIWRQEGTRLKKDK